MDSSLIYVKDTYLYAFILYLLGLGRIPYMCICLTVENCWWCYKKGGGGKYFKNFLYDNLTENHFNMSFLCYSSKVSKVDCVHSISPFYPTW